MMPGLCWHQAKPCGACCPCSNTFFTRHTHMCNSYLAAAACITLAWRMGRGKPPPNPSQNTQHQRRPCTNTYHSVLPPPPPPAMYIEAVATFRYLAACPLLLLQGDLPYMMIYSNLVNHPVMRNRYYMVLHCYHMHAWDSCSAARMHAWLMNVLRHGGSLARSYCLYDESITHRQQTRATQACSRTHAQCR